jgi:RNA polymerase sigma factor (sigma-70 family)
MAAPLWSRFPSTKGESGDEAALVAQAVRDLKSFEPLYRRYVDPVYRYCYRRLGSREAAEDATSLVFAKALAALPRFRGGSFRAWLFAIAHRVVVDEIRSTRRAQPLGAAALVADASPTPEELALAEDRDRSVRGLLAALPLVQRHILELRLAGLTGPEIAEALGRSHASVRTGQLRAVARLRLLLADDTDSNGRGDDQ